MTSSTSSWIPHVQNQSAFMEVSQQCVVMNQNKASQAVLFYMTHMLQALYILRLFEANENGQMAFFVSQRDQCVVLSFCFYHFFINVWFMFLRLKSLHPGGRTCRCMRSASATRSGTTDSGTERLKCGKMMRNSREMDTAAVTLSAPWYVADGRGTKTLSAQSVM